MNGGELLETRSTIRLPFIALTHRPPLDTLRISSIYNMGVIEFAGKNVRARRWKLVHGAWYSDGCYSTAQIGTGFVTDVKYWSPAEQLQQVCTFLADLRTQWKERSVLWFSLRQQLSLLKWLWNVRWQPPSWLAQSLSSGRQITEPLSFLPWTAVRTCQQKTRRLPGD